MDSLLEPKWPLKKQILFDVHFQLLIFAARLFAYMSFLIFTLMLWPSDENHNKLLNLTNHWVKKQPSKWEINCNLP